MRDAEHEELVCFAFYRGWRLVQEVYGDALSGSATPQRLYIMGACRERARTVGELAALLHIDSAAISNLLRRMEGDGLVVRSRSKADGRGVQVSLTDAGRAFLAERDARISEIDARLAEELPPAARRGLRDVVRHLARIAEASRAEAPATAADA